MAQVIVDLDDFISYLNTLLEMDSSAPSSGDEDYTVWTALANIAVDLWENEEGVLWEELFVKLADASDGNKTTSAATNSYTCPTDFRFPASGFVWLGSGTNKTALKVIKQAEIQLYENNTSRWCYFTRGSSPTLEINPNLTITAGYTISYNYYKYATKLSSGSDEFEMSDPMFAVYYAFSEIDKEDETAPAISSQKLEGMKTKNEMPAWLQEDSLMNKTEDGFGT